MGNCESTYSILENDVKYSLKLSDLKHFLNEEEFTEARLEILMAIIQNTNWDSYQKLKVPDLFHLQNSRNQIGFCHPIWFLLLTNQLDKLTMLAKRMGPETKFIRLWIDGILVNPFELFKNEPKLRDETRHILFEYLPLFVFGKHPLRAGLVKEVLERHPPKVFVSSVWAAQSIAFAGRALDLEFTPKLVDEILSSGHLYGRDLTSFIDRYGKSSSVQGILSSIV